MERWTQCLLSRLIDVIHWLVRHRSGGLETVCCLAALNCDRLAGAWRQLHGIDWVVLGQPDDFDWILGSSLRTWVLVLHDSHATGFHYNVIQVKNKKKTFFRDKNFVQEKLLMSWIEKVAISAWLHSPAGALPATFCFDSSSDIISGYLLLFELILKFVSLAVVFAA